MKLRSFATTLGLAVTLIAGLSAPARAARGITIKGSDTMVILGQRWAEAYMGASPGAIIQVTGGGSGTGIAALINGTTDICQSSRAMKDDERKKLRDRYQTLGTEIPVARDGLSIYLHESNTVKSLTIPQLREIYTGVITNWKAVGGLDAPITLYSRENNSGTYVYFKDHVLLGRDYSARCQTLPGTAAVVNAVARDPNGIGYGGAAYAAGVRECGVQKATGGPAVLPTEATIRDGTYPITRFLYFYTRTRPAGDVKKFVDWVLSADGQALATKVGYFPVR
ncbi:MAG: phosphate ABC transporter substrate-binding protein [Candidatus Eisenbacteria bacterium]|uniref:Phosphate-binding protein n=1 Tax=Eiseniibacteriota bacterium TaxID=2212470 RepID=A0A849T0D3_UNCEI|nr:phosphate ABC transporter substrate-binding protein [Candidatus Eisenbacteria bacterium]